MQRSMNLVPLNIDSIQLGQPLPFVLRDSEGLLLAQKGYVVRTRAELDAMLARGLQLCVDTTESGDSHRAYVAQLHRMLNTDQALGQIAAVKLSAGAAPAKPDRPPEPSGRIDWGETQLRATQLLRSPSAAPDFPARLQALHADLVRQVETLPDPTLLALMHLAAREIRMYSATHAMLVSCIVMLVARETLRWPPERVQTLGLAALSMNISMTALQDQLALQTQPLTTEQMNAIDSHVDRSVAQLRDLGVTDAVWLEAVAEHHRRAPGPLAGRTEGQQMARLIQRADTFSARMSPRSTRNPMPVTAALQASYHDENQKVDEAGAAMVRTLGIYPPGAYVRLASQEVAVVLRRGTTATTPRVAVVLNQSGMPTGELIPRDTRQPASKVVAPVARHDVRVQVRLERLLALAERV